VHCLWLCLDFEPKLLPHDKQLKKSSIDAEHTPILFWKLPNCYKLR